MYNQIKILICLIAAVTIVACKDINQQKFPAESGARMLQVELKIPEPWKKIVIGPTHPNEYPNIPQRFSMFMTGESTGALKPYLLIKDSAGKEYSILLAMTTGYYVGGKTISLNLRHGDKTSHNKPGVFPLSNLKPPIKLKGLLFWCRKPLRDTTFYFDNLKFDDTVVESFDSDSKWRVVAEEGRGSKGILGFHQGSIPGRGMEGFVIPESFPDREGSLSSNTSFEKDNNQDGMPDGWFHANREHLVPLKSSGDPMFSQRKYKGKIAIEKIGAESPRSVSIRVADDNSWAAMATILKDVKPNTDYTVSLWYRQPEVGDTVLMLFGSKTRMNNQFELNSEHWIRYSGIFNSGSFSGNCNVAVGVANPEKPTKIYVDKIEIYEGWSPIGYNQARMQHYYYSFAEISQDMTSYVPFAYECLFEKGKWPDEIEYVLELPEDIRVETSAGWYMRRGHTWFTWRGEAHYRAHEERIIRDGKPYVHHSIILPKWGATDERSMVNYVVPVGIRDGWRGAVGRYSGYTNLAFGLSTQLTEGSRKGYYYAKWNNGKQEAQELDIRIVRVPEVKRPLKRMVTIIDSLPFNADQFPNMIKTLQRAGVNGLSRSNPKLWNSRMRYHADWINFPMYHYRTSDPEAFAMGIDGKRKIGGRARCMTYRGPDWNRYMIGLFNKMDEGYNVFMFDDARPATCYDKKCKAEFARMLEIHAKLPYVDPREFMATGWKDNPVYKTLWNDFQLWIYGLAAQDMKEEMLAHSKKRKKDTKIYFLQSSSPVRPNHEFANATTHRTFDFEGIQAYLYCYHKTYLGSPKQIGHNLQLRQEGAGKYANFLVPTLSPGLTYMHPTNSLDPHSQMKYQILEAAMTHKALGYNMYAGADIDITDMRYIAEANIILSRFEDIFVDGLVIKGLHVSGKNSSINAKRLGKHTLLLVADYSNYEHIKTQVKMTLPENLKGRYRDVETGELLVCEGFRNHFTVIFDKRRARLFYRGTWSLSENQ